MNALPLIAGHGLDDVFAWQPAGARRVRNFLADAEALAARLPPGRALLNLCHDRYRFAVGFAAGLIDGKASLQPSSQSAETLGRIRADFPDAFCLCDGDLDTLDLPRCDFPDLSAADPRAVAGIPRVPADRLAAILFTSGSTGLPQPHRKTWGRLVASALAEAAALVGTVPVQHSYGFESTFLLALHGGCALWSGKPFYPQDIAAALDAVPRPRMLVTTPFHLSTLLASGIDLPAVDLLLSATAPLSDALAAEAEARTGAPLNEIYGSTESGQLACRRTTGGAAWMLLPGVRLEPDADNTTWACGGHVEGRVALSDLIDLLPDQRFLLQGRHADLVNIAGKRTSIAYLNHQIAAVPGVVDAAFFLPDDQAPDGITRLTAFVVAPTLTRRQLLDALRPRIDAVFLPRPAIFVDALPRNATGKLPRSGLQALYARKVRHAGR
jgi:acyl-coenzyme A synthetase/AMP-(fatty) acid ligase